jgi:hypothetical protein
MRTEITTIELFKPLTDIQVGNVVYDLHNEYLLTEIKFDGLQRLFTLRFASQNEQRILICILFYNASFNLFKMDYIETNEATVLDNFYRGRLMENDKLVEWANANQGCFYVAFCNGNSFEVLSDKVFVEVED